MKRRFAFVKIPNEDLDHSIVLALVRADIQQRCAPISSLIPSSKASPRRTKSFPPRSTFSTNLDIFKQQIQAASRESLKITRSISTAYFTAYGCTWRVLVFHTCVRIYSFTVGNREWLTKGNFELAECHFPERLHQFLPAQLHRVHSRTASSELQVSSEYV